MANELAVMIPIILFIVIGIVFITAIFFRSREKQMLIEKGLSPEAIKQFFQEKRSPYNLMKVGIIILFFGLGLGFGLMMKDASDKEYWVPFMLFAVTGIGFILANLIARILEKKEVAR